MLDPEELRAHFQKFGAKGGKTAAKRMSRKDRVARAKKAAASRWKNRKGGKR